MYANYQGVAHISACYPLVICVCSKPNLPRYYNGALFQVGYALEKLDAAEDNGAPEDKDYVGQREGEAAGAPQAAVEHIFFGTRFFSAPNLGFEVGYY